MAPFDDFQSRDLAWLSDFVMQQMVMMMRPMIDHLQQNDAALDYTQRAVQRLSMELTELRGDQERNSKYLAILRQGLGVQSEGKCILQRSIEGTTRTVKRLDEQMDNMLGVVRGVDDSIGQLCSGVRGAHTKYEELNAIVAQNAESIEDIQGRVERTASESRSVKDDLLSTSLNIDVLQRELRDFRRLQLNSLNATTKLPMEESSERRKTCAPSRSEGAKADRSDPSYYSMASHKKGFPSEVPGKDGHGGGGSQDTKRERRKESGAKSSALLQDFDTGCFSVPRSSSKVNMWNDVCSEPSGGASHSGGGSGSSPEGATPVCGSRGDSRQTRLDGEASPSSRLPVLVPGPGAARRPPERDLYGEPSHAPRLRFSETMTGQPTSRGTPGPDGARAL